MYLQQKCFLDINLSKEKKYQDVTIFCQNGTTFQANSLLLSSIFPMMKNIFRSIIDNNEHFMISIPDIERMELEILFNGIHQQSSTINIGSVLLEFLKPSFKDEVLNNDSE